MLTGRFLSPVFLQTCGNATKLNLRTNLQPSSHARGLYLWTVWSLYLVGNKFNWSKVSIFVSRQFYRIPRTRWIAGEMAKKNTPRYICTLFSMTETCYGELYQYPYYRFMALYLLRWILPCTYNSSNLICLHKLSHKRHFYYGMLCVQNANTFYWKLLFFLCCFYLPLFVINNQLQTSFLFYCFEYWANYIDICKQGVAMFQHTITNDY